MTMETMPADWAIKAAIIAAADDDYEYDPDVLRIVKNPADQNVVVQRLSLSIIAHARLIEQTQPAPVARELLCAREAAFHAFYDAQQYDLADALNYGLCDNDPIIRAVIGGITLYETGFGEK